MPRPEALTLKAALKAERACRMGVSALILESNPVARDCLRRVVAESFCEPGAIDEAAGTGDALDMMRQRAAQSRPYDLALLDLDHPDGRWADLLQRARGAARVRVVCTLIADDDHLFPALQAGADGYLLKEDRFEVLVEQLQRLARGLPPLTPGIARRALACLRPDLVARDRLPDERELDLLQAASRGFTLREIARQRNVRWQTLYVHLRSVYRKLSGATSPEAPAHQETTAGPE